MDKDCQFRKEITRSLSRLTRTGRPSRNALMAEAEKLYAWRRACGVSGLWDDPPLIVTATIDDAWGHGLEVIHAFSHAAGLIIHPLGLMKPPREIIETCLRLSPDLLGMTVLQFDTEQAIQIIRREIPPRTLIICGGPLFHADPDLKTRCGINVVAANAVRFMEFLMTYPGSDPENESDDHPETPATSNRDVPKLTLDQI